MISVIKTLRAGSPSTRVSDILRGPDHTVMRAIQAGVDRVNKSAVSRAACVQKWTVLPVDVSIPGTVVTNKLIF